MIEQVEIYIVLYIAAILVQGCVSSLKKSQWGLIPLIVTSLLFIILRDNQYFIILSVQTILYGIIRLIIYVVNNYIRQVKISKINQSKIKDL